MSDDEADPELLALLRKALGLGGGAVNPGTAETKVLENAQFVFDNAIDVALSSSKTKEAAETIWQHMQKKSYSTQTWSEHELHPQAKSESTVDFVFTMDLLNFSFWSALPDDKRFAIEYRGKRWTGYWSLVAALQRALDEDIPITSPEFWTNEEEFTEDLVKHVFRSATDEEIPLLEERHRCLREAGRVLCEDFDGSFINCIYSANHSAAALVNLLAESFSCFRDETTFQGRRVRLYKRAQILVADLWACFNGEGYGEFHDIEKITMFADYRIPQMLHHLGCLMYSPPLENHIRDLKEIPTGSNWEIELRATSIWCVELIKREIERKHPEVKLGLRVNGESNGHSNGEPNERSEKTYPENGPTANGHSENGYSGNAHLGNGQLHTKGHTNGTNGHSEHSLQDGGADVLNDQQNGSTGKHSKHSSTSSVKPLGLGINAILIDFFLYDTIKELEENGRETSIPHHRTRSIWY